MKAFLTSLGVGLCWGLTACQPSTEAPPPAKLVPRAQMAHLLAEVHMLEVRVDAINLPTDSAQALFLHLQDSLLRQQGLSDSTFKRSYRYYAGHGKDLQEIYQVVIDSLTQRTTQLRPKNGPAPSADTPPPITPAEVKRRSLRRLGRLPGR